MRGFDGGLMLVFGLHGLFMVVTLLAIIFLIMWAYKALDKKGLKHWTKWLFIVGVIGCVITAAGMFIGMRGFGDDGFGKGKSFKNYDISEKCPFLEEVKKDAVPVKTEAEVPAVAPAK